VSVTAYIALGSNLGDRRAHLDRALADLRARPGIIVKRVSSYHETLPAGGPSGQEMYLNAAAEVETDLDAKTLLHALLEVEHALGRTRGERFGPRTIDLDLLLYDEETYTDEELTLPHPRMHERVFVLAPLAEIAARTRHPLLNVTI
jgi:2-amino-4-hydroxy-6-hydroxymethyldihydropteridine diphosphokinase